MDTLENKNVTTRKEHECFGCGRKFPKGTILNYKKVVDGGEIRSSYWCETCRAYWAKYMQSSDEISFGDLKDEDGDDWERLRKEIEKTD